MDGIRTIHNILGERILPVVIIAVAIWFAVAWKDGPPHPAARLFPFLIYLQFALGLI